VSEQLKLEKAVLKEMDADFKNPLPGGPTVQVQFNPETLKVSFANQVVQPQGGGDQRGQQARQFVGAGTTKLTLQLWFDVTARPLPPGKESISDVRELTKEVAYFITPKPNDQAGGGAPKGGGGAAGQPPPMIPPAVRFIWGSFQFDGMMDSLEETLEFWSGDGRPLRASLGLALSQQKITFAFSDKARGGSGPGAPSTPGTSPLAQAPAGATLQGLAVGAGVGADWQSIAAANGIENPRLLAPGQLIDLNLRAPQIGVSQADVSVGLSVGF
jgi:hypothetical protein